MVLTISKIGTQLQGNVIQLKHLVSSRPPDQRLVRVRPKGKLVSCCCKETYSASQPDGKTDLPPSDSMQGVIRINLLCTTH
jgi:hypothetical protein